MGKREPVLIMAALQAVLAVPVAFGLNWTTEQVGGSIRNSSVAIAASSGDLNDEVGLT